MTLGYKPNASLCLKKGNEVNYHAFVFHQLKF